MHARKHNLVHELPEYREQIHGLKMTNRHFAAQFDKYHNLDDEILRVEGGIEDTSVDCLRKLKKDRLMIKDELLSMLMTV